MLYKEFGKTGIKMSALGFGAMRLPMARDGEKSIVNYEKAVPVMHRAFDLGVNYIDTAPFYCDSDSEVAVGKALKGYRDKVYLSTKNPISSANGDDLRIKLEESLKKLDTDYIDFYHMWGINLKTFNEKIMVKGGHMEAAMKAKDEGLIKHISFSFHDSAENMIPMIDSGCFESVLCQYNLLDRSNEKSIAYANEKGLGVVIMGPVGGGRLGAPSSVLTKLLDREISSTAEMALRFVLANNGVNIALSGMSSVEMVEENAKVASIEGHLTADELEKVAKMMEENKRLAELYCTGCKYCMPCSQNINIPHIFALMNNHRVYGLTDHSRSEYKVLKTDLSTRKPEWLKQHGVDASNCIECGECESKCPQKIEIIKQLKESHKDLYVNTEE